MQQVIIVGGGPIGLLCAKWLTQAEFDVCLIEKGAPLQQQTAGTTTTLTTLNEEAVLANPRAYALSPASIALLQQINIWDELLTEQAPCPYRGMYLWDRESTASIQLHAEDAGLPELGFIVQHDVLMHRLWASLKDVPNFRLITEARPEALHTTTGAATLTLDSGEALTAELVIGADGQTSDVRDLAGLTAKEKDYQQKALTLPVRLDDWQAGMAAQVFTSDSILGVLPISCIDPDLKLLIWSVKASLADQLLKGDDAALISAIAGTLELPKDRVLLAGTKLAFPLSRRLATTWVKNAVALVGDAAHHIHPLAGQGLNLGFADVANLTRRIKQAQKSGIAAGNLRHLRQYQRTRLPQVLAMAGFIDAVRIGCAQQTPFAITARNLLASLLHQSDDLKSLIMRIASGHLPWPAKPQSSGKPRPSNI